MTPLHRKILQAARHENQASKIARKAGTNRFSVWRILKLYDVTLPEYKGGGPRLLDYEAIKRDARRGMSRGEIRVKHGCSMASVYKVAAYIEKPKHEPQVNQKVSAIPPEGFDWDLLRMQLRG